MIAVLQRVSHARVDVSGETIGSIDTGLLVFVAVEQADDKQDVLSVLKRIIDYRIFADHAGKMNLSLMDVQGGMLLVPQFTLAADTHTGTRPSFTPAAPPEKGRKLFEYLVTQASERYRHVATGQFAADMQVTLTNDGPVTFILRSSQKNN